jgi:putative addiction module component (TIGR02574 family)
MPVHIETTLKEIAGWPVEDQLELLSQAWDRLVESGWQPELTDELKAELDRRLDAADANPQDTVSWEKIVEDARRAP